MKRYSLSDGGIRGNFDLVMSEHRIGEWVKWKDVKGAVTAFNDWVERGIWPVDRGAACNCAENVMITTTAFGSLLEKQRGTEWICPAHGYKKR